MPKPLMLLSPRDIRELPDQQKHPPPSMQGNCLICGKCCLFYKCPALDRNTNRCRIYSCRPAECRMWPQSQFQICQVDCLGYSQTGL